MADVEDLRRIAQRDLTGRELKRYESLFPQLAVELEPAEQVLKLGSGDWYRNRSCVLIATSRQLIVADAQRTDPIPYDKMLAFDFDESWRKARVRVRAQGIGADVSGIHLDIAREIQKIIVTARRASQAGSGTGSSPGNQSR
jgi:hypothetical protein